MLSNQQTILLCNPTHKRTDLRVKEKEEETWKQKQRQKCKERQTEGEMERNRDGERKAKLPIHKQTDRPADRYR